MPIGRNLLWSITNNGNCLLEKLVSGIQISLNRPSTRLPSASMAR
jgi:hypothetical protein